MREVLRVECHIGDRRLPVDEVKIDAAHPLSLLLRSQFHVDQRVTLSPGTGDTLTEDLDLSIRCAIKGWRAALISDLEVPGELPETAAAWRAQQARGTKGHAQCAKKLLPMLWTSELPGDI